jgi:hypothetical protein
MPRLPMYKSKKITPILGVLIVALLNKFITFIIYTDIIFKRY